MEKERADALEMAEEKTQKRKAQAQSTTIKGWMIFEIINFVIQ